MTKREVVVTISAEPLDDEHVVIEVAGRPYAVLRGDLPAPDDQETEGDHG